MNERSALTTKKLTGAKVWMERPTKANADAAKKMGRVRSCVFHPDEPRCVGFLVKRPDVALMFHRHDLFVAIDGFELIDGVPLVSDRADATDKGACKKLGVSLDDCVLWVGLPMLCEDGTALGLVQSVTFAEGTGEVLAIELTQGSTANVLLGKREVPVELIRGFRRGIGAQLTMRGATMEVEVGDEGVQPEMLGAILVSDRVKDLEPSKGAAEKAGEATALAADKAKRTVEKVKPKVTSAASTAASTAGEAINKGAYATGRQLKRASGMFSAFKEEFDKARHGDK